MDKYGFFSILLLNFALFYSLNFFFLKKKILIDKIHNNDVHKNFINKSFVPISGGIILLINCFSQNFFNNIYYLACFFIMFLIGLLSDTARLNSPSKRLFIQILLVIIFLFFSEILIQTVKIPMIDSLLESKFFSVIFSTFCLLILINGSNFIDGLNFQSSGYFLSVLLSLILFNYEILDKNDQEIIISLLLFLIVFIFFNVQNKSFLGDGGIYLLSFIVGLFLILFQKKTNVSPYYVVVLLWYPAFENFFSIFRKLLLTKKNPDHADAFHLHHLFVKYLKSRFELSGNKISFLASFLINFLNFIFFSIAVNFIYKTSILLFLITLQSVIYILGYYFLFRIKKK